MEETTAKYWVKTSVLESRNDRPLVSFVSDFHIKTCRRIEP